MRFIGPRCKRGALTGRCRRNLILLLGTQSPPTRRTHDALNGPSYDRYLSDNAGEPSQGQEEISEGDLNNLEPRQVHGVLRQSGAKTSRSLHAGQKRRRGGPAVPDMVSKFNVILNRWKPVQRHMRVKFLRKFNP